MAKREKVEFETNPPGQMPKFLTVLGDLNKNLQELNENLSTGIEVAQDVGQQFMVIIAAMAAKEDTSVEDFIRRSLATVLGKVAFRG